MAKPIGILVDVQFDSKKNVNAKLKDLMKDLQKEIAIQVDMDTEHFTKTFNELKKTLTDINKQFQETFNVSSYMKEHERAVDNLIEKQVKYHRVLGSSLNIGDGSKGFDELQARANEIRASVDSLAKVSFDANKNGALEKATITYTDSVGKMVTETMRWVKITNKAGDEVKNIFTTVGTHASDNVTKVTNANNKALADIVKLQQQLNIVQGSGKIDGDTISVMQKRLDDINSKKATTGLKELQVELSKIGDEVDELEKCATQLYKIEKALNNSDIALDKSQKKYGSLFDDKDVKKSMEEYRRNIAVVKQLQLEIGQGGSFDNQKLNEYLNRVSTSMKQVTTEVTNSQRAFKLHQKDAVSFGGAIKDVATKVGLFSLAYDALKQLKRGFIDGIESVKAMDKAITTLSITMDGLTNEKLTGMVTRSQELATSLSSTTNEILEMVTTFANAGETIDSIFNKTSSAVILQNLTGLSSSDVVNTIQSATRQFDELSDGSEKSSMKVTDSMVAISKALGVDFSRGVREMSDSLSILGSLSSQVGGDLDQTLAMIAGGMEKLRLSGSELATSTKTIKLWHNGIINKPL